MLTSPTILGGKLAVPLNNDHGSYSVHIFSLPDGQEIDLISNARQPSFRRDGRKLLINHEGNERESIQEYTLADGRTFRYALESRDLTGSIYEYNVADGTETQVSDNARDAHPFYNPRGDRAVYDNTTLAFDPGRTQLANIFVQCGLLPPHQEQEERCWALAKFGMLVWPASAGAIEGSHPVWAANGTIIYRAAVEKLTRLRVASMQLTPKLRQGSIAELSPADLLKTSAISPPTPKAT